MEGYFNVLTDWVLWVWAQWQVKVLVLHVLVNVVAAIAVSIATGEFILAKTGEFLYKKVLPLVLVYAAFAFAGSTLDMAWVATAAWLALETSLTSDLLDNLKKLGLARNGSRLGFLSEIPPSLTKEREIT